MDDTRVTAFASHVAASLAGRADDMARRWLEQLLQRLPVSPRRIFPQRTLLNHVPQLLATVAHSLTSSESLAEIESLVQETERLAELRRSQGYELDEIVAEFDLLGEILFETFTEVASEYAAAVAPAHAGYAALRLQKALGTLVTLTTGFYRKGEEAGRADRARLLGEFGRSVTHELRNRLNSILLNVSLLRHELRRADANAGDDTLDRIEDGLRRVEGVVADVYTVSVASRRRRPFELHRQSLDELVEELVEDLGEYAAGKEVELRVRAPLPEIQVDASRLRLVLVNVVGNAIKYHQPTLDRRWVEIAATRTAEPRQWRVDVADNGLGIPEDARESIFQEHVRLHSADGETDGDGLGLWLALQAVEQMGGRIWVAPRLGGGSVFSFTLQEPEEELTS